VGFHDLRYHSHPCESSSSTCAAEFFLPPCASPTELSARWVLSSSHQIPNKRSLLYGSDTGSTQGSPQRDRDRENEIRVWTQIEEKEVASSSSRSNRACGVRPHNRCLDLLRRACVRACVRWGLLFATMMIAAQLLATHFSSTAANHAQANARILWLWSIFAFREHNFRMIFLNSVLRGRSCWWMFTGC